MWTLKVQCTTIVWKHWLWVGANPANWAITVSSTTLARGLQPCQSDSKINLQVISCFMCDHASNSRKSMMADKLDERMSLGNSPGCTCLTLSDLKYNAAASINKSQSRACMVCQLARSVHNVLHLVPRQVENRQTDIGVMTNRGMNPYFQPKQCICAIEAGWKERQRDT